MQMIEDYSKYLKTLSVLSKDKHSHKILIDDSDEAHKMYAFDDIRNEICRRFRGEPNASCDAYWEKDGMRYLIEFKNQSEGNIKRVKLHNKAYDSIALLLMNENITRQELLNNTIMIVVYNNKKHISDASSYNPSRSMDKIAHKLKNYAKLSKEGEPLVKFKMGKYKGTLYHDVYTLEVEEFIKDFYPILFD